MKPVTTFLNILWHPFTVWCVTYEKFANYINMIIKDVKQREGSRRPLPLMTCSPAGGVGRGRGCRDEGYLPAEALIDQTFCTLHRLQTPSPALGQLGWVGGGYVRGRRTVPKLSSSPLYHPYRVCTHTPHLCSESTSCWSADLQLITIKAQINCSLLNWILILPGSVLERLVFIF